MRPRNRFLVVVLLLLVAGWWEYHRQAASAAGHGVQATPGSVRRPGPIEARGDPASAPEVLPAPEEVAGSGTAPVGASSVPAVSTPGVRVPGNYFSVSDYRGYESPYLVVSPEQADALAALEERYADITARAWRDRAARPGEGAAARRRGEIAEAFLAELQPILDRQEFLDYLAAGNFGSDLRAAALARDQAERNAAPEGQPATDDIFHGNEMWNPVSVVKDEERARILALPESLKTTISRVTLQALADERLLRIQMRHGVDGVGVDGGTTVYDRSLQVPTGNRVGQLSSALSALFSLVVDLPGPQQSAYASRFLKNPGGRFSSAEIEIFRETLLGAFIQEIAAGKDLTAAVQ